MTSVFSCQTSISLRLANPIFIIYSLLPLLSPLVTITWFSVSISLISVLYIDSFVLPFRFHIQVISCHIYLFLTCFT